MRKITVKTASRHYPAYITEGWDKLLECVQEAFPGARGAVIVTDDNVGPLYAAGVRASLMNIFSSVAVCVLKAGEKYKNMDSLREIFDFLYEHRTGRQTVVFALGGGVVGDLAGLAASVFMRGMPFAQLPTSTIAMTDSSVGGKTGIDYRGVKNLIGSFYQPEMVFANISALKTLPERDYISGLAETVKYGLVIDWIFYDYLAENVERIKSRDPELLGFIAERCMALKAEIIENDERDESGGRAILNLGHTFGHALEASGGYELSHGEAVSLGIVLAAYLSRKRGLLRGAYLHNIEELLSRLGLPVRTKLPEGESLALEALSRDKKGGRFILLKDIGRPVTADDITENEMASAIRYLGRE